MTWPRLQCDSFPARMLPRKSRWGPGSWEEEVNEGDKQRECVRASLCSHFHGSNMRMGDGMSWLTLILTTSLMSEQIRTWKNLGRWSSVSSSGEGGHEVFYGQVKPESGQKGKTTRCLLEKKILELHPSPSSTCNLQSPSPFLHFPPVHEKRALQKVTSQGDLTINS